MKDQSADDERSLFKGPMGAVVSRRSTDLLDGLFTAVEFMTMAEAKYIEDYR